MHGLSDKNATQITPLKKTYNIGGKNITLESGKLALLINGAITISDDIGNVLLTTAGIKEQGVNESADFFPLVVDYQEKFYATGKIGGNRFQKREGRPSETSILTARLIDRPIRPMFPKGFINDTQIIATVLSSSGESDLGFMGITGASLALMMTGAPFEGPVAGVKVVMTEAGEFIFDPTFKEEQTAKLNLLVAGTPDAITMVEAGANEVSEDNFIEALEYSHNIIKELCKAQLDYIADYKKQFGINEIKEYYNLPDTSLYAKIKDYLTEEKLECLYEKGKKEFHDELVRLEEEVKNYFNVESTGELKEVCSIGDEECELEDSLGEMIYKRVKEVMRKNILEKEKRLDGRKLNEVREVIGEVGLLPRVHGSALFQRGMTQALTITTLGGPGDVQTIDDMYEEQTKRYIHHYNFPPFSVGEVRAMRGVGRREIGHGRLAERALEAVIPDEKDFPYMIRVVSEITTCNGSSSMASVCGSTMSLMQAGVPIKAPVSGVAMGMIYDETTGNYKILSDIQAQEDFLGDMDFKVAMTPNGITTMQLDVKIKGLSMQVFRDAFAQAKQANDYIRGEMLKVIAEPNKGLSPYAPMIISHQIEVDEIGTVIGKGGETVQKLTKEYNVDISISEEGLISITAKDGESGKSTLEAIKKILWKPAMGETVEGKVVRILDGIGAIVEFSGKTGMIHISKLGERVNKIEDKLNMGDHVKALIIQIRDDKIGLELKEKLN